MKYFIEILQRFFGSKTETKPSEKVCFPCESERPYNSFSESTN